MQTHYENRVVWLLSLSFQLSDPVQKTVLVLELEGKKKGVVSIMKLFTEVI